MLTIEEIVEDCQTLMRGANPPQAVAGYLAQLLRDLPDELAPLLGDGTDSVVLHQAGNLTVVKLVLPPQYELYPHNHLMWAAVATVVGREDNTFFVHEGDRLERVSGAAYEEGQVGVLPETVIHAVRNPSRAHTVGLHVYGGNLMAAAASEWDPETFTEHPHAGLGGLGPLGRTAFR
ncbi:MAG: hypothetical protein ACJ735_03190 [Actinomycetes bacterium]